MRIFWALVALVAAPAADAGESSERRRELPPLLRAVSDEPGVLSLAEGQALSRRIAEIERATGVKMVAMVVVTVAPESIESYVQRQIDRWKRDSRAFDNGRFVFVVITRNDREIRIVPGPELAWVLQSLSGGAMVENVPKLSRTDQYYEALLTIVDRLAQFIGDRQRAVRRHGVFQEPERGFREEQGGV